MAKMVTGATIWKSRGCSQEYQALEMQIVCGTIEDAAKVYSDHPTEHNLKQLQEIRKKGTSTKYLSASDAWRMKWQVDRENMLRAESCHSDRSWYGMHIDDVEHNHIDRLAKMARQISKDGHYWPGLDPVAFVRDYVDHVVAYHSYGQYVILDKDSDQFAEVMRPAWTFPPTLKDDGTDKWYWLDSVDEPDRLRATYRDSCHVMPEQDHELRRASLDWATGETATLGEVIVPETVWS